MLIIITHIYVLMLCVNDRQRFSLSFVACSFLAHPSNAAMYTCSFPYSGNISIKFKLNCKPVKDTNIRNWMGFLIIWVHFSILYSKFYKCRFDFRFCILFSFFLKYMLFARNFLHSITAMHVYTQYTVHMIDFINDHLETDFSYSNV